MSTLDKTAREWLMARNVIATAIDEWMRGLPQHGERLAAAIIARLASHDPPLLITTGDVFDQCDALLAACKGMVKIARNILANDDPDGESGQAASAILQAIANAEKQA